MKISAAKPKASAGSSSGDMNRRSTARMSGERLRAMPSAAAVPSTTEITVVQNATTRLFQAAACIWSASISAAYQRSDSPSCGNFSDCDAVSEVSSTISVGPTRKTMATAASAPNTRRMESASQSMALCIRLALAADQVEDGDGGEHGEHENHRDRRRERPVVRADRLLIDVQRHVDEPRAAYQRLGHERRHAGR